MLSLPRDPMAVTSEMVRSGSPGPGLLAPGIPSFSPRLPTCPVSDVNDADFVRFTPTRASLSIDGEKVWFQVMTPLREVVAVGDVGFSGIAS